MSLIIHRQCPDCNTPDSVHLDHQWLICSKDTCSFKHAYACPICDTSLSRAYFTNTENGLMLTCPACKQSLVTKKIQNLIENSLIIDKDIRCDFCSGPTTHRQDMNLGHRCLFYPACSGQSSLFDDDKESFTFLDFETSGLEVGRDEIIEIGALKLDKEGYEHTYQTLIKPSCPIDERITKITGINDDMVADAPSIDACITKLYEFIGDSTIIAHNADFDIPWLLTHYLKYKLPHKENTIVCTFKWAKRNKEPRCSLGALTAKYNIGHNNAHRALADSAATKELYFIFENAKIEARPERLMSAYLSQSERLVSKMKNIPDPPN